MLTHVPYIIQYVGQLDDSGVKVLSSLLAQIRWGPLWLVQEMALPREASTAGMSEV